MDAEQAWQSALGQLQENMPKASFDTWVRDTQVIAYDDGRFQIGVRNAYARDWLESRLSSKITCLLAGIMDQPVEVQFLIAPEQPLAEDQEEGDKTEEPKLSAEEQVKAEGSQPSAETPAPDKELDVEALYELAYDEIVIPEHVTLVPRYFLRHLRLIGPDLGWLYLGFRQAAFNAGARSGTRRERFSGKTIAAISGIAVSTFWNRVGKDETWKLLRGLVTTTASTPEWDTSSSTPKRLPRRYIVSMTLPLTAADAGSLRRWLATNVESMGGPEQVIEAAAGTPLDELLPPGAQAQEDDSPETVPTILRSLFGEQVPTERLAALATRLHKRIMPDTDRLGVTHFFVEHILPHLSTGPGWMLTLLRDQGYCNRETGEVRDRVRIAGGYAEIAGWLGVTPDTIKRWLHGKHSESRSRGKDGDKGGVQRGPGRHASEIGKLTNPVLRIYLREIETGKALSVWASARTFQVLMDEIPSEILEAAFDEQASQALDHALSSDEDRETARKIAETGKGVVCGIGMARYVVPEGDISARFVVSGSPISARFVQSESPISARFVDDQRAVCTIVSARFVHHQRAVCRVFKSLNYLNQITNDSNIPNQPIRELSDSLNDDETQNAPGGRVSSVFSNAGNEWDWTNLTQTLMLNPATARRLQQQSIPAWALVAWVLNTLTMKNVKVPNLAVAKVESQLERYQAGEDFESLAKHPAELRQVLDRETDAPWHKYSLTESDGWTDEFSKVLAAYERVFKEPPRPAGGDQSENMGRALQIRRLLFGVGE